MRLNPCEAPGVALFGAPESLVAEDATPVVGQRREAFRARDGARYLRVTTPGGHVRWLSESHDEHGVVGAIAPGQTPARAPRRLVLVGRYGSPRLLVASRSR